MTAPSRRLVDAGLALLDRLDAAHVPQPITDVFRDQLSAPLRVVVTGRVSSGKSTLVNAVVGALVAPTAACELTAVLTAFRFGAPPRATIHLADGGVRETTFTDDGPSLDDLAPEEVAHVQVRMPEGPLRGLTLVDTPGLGSATTDHARRTASHLVSGALRGQAPEVVLYVARDDFRDTDRELLHALRQDWTPAGGPAPRAVVVLSHADNFGSGAWLDTDPIERAREHAATIAERDDVDAVAVSGLLAETARTGRWRESHLRALRRLASISDEELSLALLVGSADTLDAAALAELHRLLGGYGLRHGRARAASSVELREWLDHVSGIAAVERAIEGHDASGSRYERIEAMLSTLERSARRDGWPPEAEALLERARSAPAFHPLREWQALSELRQHRPDSDMVDELAELLEGAARAGSPSECTARSAQHQARVATAGTGVEVKAASVLARSYLLRAREAEDV